MLKYKISPFYLSIMISGVVWRYNISKYIITNTMGLDIIHRPVFILKHRLVYFSEHVSETGFCLHLQVKSMNTQFGPIDTACPYYRTPVPAPKFRIQAKHSARK
jgi:hypothetical protein